jgi:ornithine carbamoyltransferase
MNLAGRSFLKLKDYSPEEIRYLIELSSRRRRRRGFPMKCSRGRTSL